MSLKTFQPILRPSIGHVTVIAALALVFVGLAAIETAPAGVAGNVAKKQTVFLGIGVLVMLLTALPHHRHIGQMSYPLTIFCLILLAVLLMPGLPQSIAPIKNGARRWYNLRITLFQPSELAKVAFVLALAQYLRFRSNYRSLTGLIGPLLIAFVPMGLILVEPDLGTALIFLPVLFAMLIAAGARIKHLVLIVVIGLSLMPMMYPLLRPHQKARIRDVVARMAGDTSHQQGISFQGATSTTLAAAGGLSGHPKKAATNLIRYNRLPEAHNDMIFSVICVRWGLLGAVGVMTLYLVLIGSALVVAALNKDPFARLMVVGVVAIMFTQLFVNVGMNIGLLPITGMTLPLISYGGSSLLVNFMMLGLILNASAHRPMMMGRDAFEH